MITKNKIFNWVSFSFLSLSMMSVVGCGDSLLDSLNSNQEVVSSDDNGTSKAESYDQAVGMFLQAQSLIHDLREHKYQYQFSLHIDNYAGYFCLPQNFDGRLPSTYAVNKDFASGPRQAFFWTGEQTLPVIRGSKDLNLEEIGAMSSIMYCLSAQELADVHGPFPWLDYKNEKQDPPLTYYSVEDIYDSIFVELDKAVATLKNYNQTSSAHQDTIKEILNTKDRIGGGKIENWIKFASSIRLRMAMHMSVVDEPKAKLQAKKALDDGVLQNEDKDIAYDVTLVGGRNPLEFISNVWGDTRLNASFENLLKRMNSPLLAKWFATNGKDIKTKSGTVGLESNKEYVGIRAGIQTTPRNDNNQYLKYSTISTAYAQRPVYIFKVCEVLFLKAEAALRWGDDFTNGDPDFILYEDAIVHSLVSEGISNSSERDKYLALETALDIDYIDYYDNTNNAKGLVTIGVAMNDEDPKEVKLEKIITQKYIANFPLSLESWTDLRRTGYPRIFAVVDDDGDGSIPEGDIIRRIPYIVNDDSDKADVITSAIPAMGSGGDYQGNRLWWDTGRLF